MLTAAHGEMTLLQYLQHKDRLLDPKGWLRLQYHLKQSLV